MKIVLYDEGMYPSGSACGLVVKDHPELASEGITLTQTVLPGDELLAQAENGALVVRKSGGTMRGLHWGEDDGEKKAPKTADILNPAAVSRFIELTHEAYYRELKEYFGAAIIGFFTDEPSILGRNVSGMFPWTHGFAEIFRRAGGNAANLTALFDGKENDDTRLYHKLLLQREGEVYYGTLSRWCKAHGIGLMGHPHQSDDMAKYVVAFEQWVKDEKIAFVASHYDGFAQDKAGVLDSMLIPAFSMLIKQGVACAVEGDIKVAMAMSILKTISGCGQLSEMYSIDFDEDICIIGHSGSGDADISQAKKPTMKIVPVFHGKTGGGYLTQFYPPVGDVTYLGITQDKDGHFKFVVAEGVNEPGPIFTFGDTNMRTRFSCGAREFCNRWSEAGPTHHMAAAPGRHIDTILKVAKIFNVPVDIVTR